MSSWVVMYMQIKSFKNGRKKVRHYARYLHCYYDYSVFPSIYIIFPKSPILPQIIQIPKKRL